MNTPRRSPVSTRGNLVIGLAAAFLAVPAIAALLSSPTTTDPPYSDPATEWFISTPAAVASRGGPAPGAWMMQQQAPWTSGVAGRATGLGDTQVSPVLQTALSPSNPAAGGSSALPTPLEQNAAGKTFVEGHWLGLEVIDLLPDLARELGIPDGERGVLVDEITLEAAESGILAGDVVRSVDGRSTSDLEKFFHATTRVRESRAASVTVGRQGQERIFVLRARNMPELGFAQMEAAQPIQPGALSPHRSLGTACTDCHIIMQTGGQLLKDAGDILPQTPPISENATPSHEYRGECSICHLVLR